MLPTTATPLDPARAAIVQDLYRIAFCRQLERDAALGGEGHNGAAAGEQSIDRLLEDYAALLRLVDRHDDADILLGLVARVPVPS